MTILAILCKQDEILDYILENKRPDLSVRVDGYTALHLAALIKDCRPLKLLFQYQWIQENINFPIELDGDFCPSHRDDGNRTLNEELAMMRCRMSKEKSVVMRHQTYKEESAVNAE
jgi:hypothetical protein